MTCYDGHSVWVNSKALALAGITKDTPNPTNGLVVKDPRTGEPTGHLKESATALVNKVKPKPTDADRRAALRKAVAHAHQFGVTSVQNAGTSFEDVALYQQALRAGELQVRTYLAMSTSSSTTEADLDRMEETRKALGNDPTLTTGAVKIYADGVIESRTAAMLAPYEHSTAPALPTCRPTSWTASWRWWTSADGRSSSTPSAIGRSACRSTPSSAPRRPTPRRPEAGGIGSSTSRPLPRPTSRASASWASSRRSSRCTCRSAT